MRIRNFLQRAPGLVEELDAAVVALIAIDPPDLAADGQRRVEELGTLGRAFLVLGVEDLEIVAVRDPALEIDVVAEDAHQLLDRLPRQLVLQRRLVEAVIEPDAALLGVAVLAVGVGLRRLLGLAFLDRRRHRDEGAAVVHRRDRLDAALAEQDHPHDLARLARAQARPDEDAHPLPFDERRRLRPAAERVDDAADLGLGRAVRLQRRLEALVALQGDVALLEQAVGGARLELRQRRHVLRDDAHLDRVEGRLDRLAESERVRQRIGLAQRPRQEELGRQRQGRPAPGFGRGAALLLDLRRDVLVAQARGARLDRRRGKVALDDRDLRVRDLGRRLGDDLLVVLLGEQAQRIEGRDVGRVEPARERQVRRDAHEGTDLDHLAVADPDRHRRPEGLLRDRDDLRAHELVAFSGRRGLVLARTPRRLGGHVLGQFREGRLALERDIDRAADERRAGERREDARAEPAQADPAAIDVAAAAEAVERRLVAGIGPGSAIRGNDPGPLEAVGEASDVGVHAVADFFPDGPADLLRNGGWATIFRACPQTRA